MNPVAALLFFITVINLLLGALVFFRNQKSPLYIALSRFIFLVAGWMFTMGAFYQTNNINFAFLWIRWTYVLGIVIANTLVYFSLVFPAGSAVPFIQRFFVYAPAFPMIIAILLIPDFLFKEIINYNWWKDVKMGVFEYTIYTIYFILVYFGAIAILFKKYFSYTGKLRLHVTYVLCAVFIAGFFGAVFDLLFPWLNLYKYIWLGPIGTLIMVGIFVYAIVKHKFLDIRLVAARTITYSLLILILGAIYAFGLFGIGTLLMAATSSTSQLIISTILALIMAFTFQPLKVQLEKLTDRIFYQGHYNTDLLLAGISSIMSTNIELDAITDQILKTLTKEMRISRGMFILLDKQTVYGTISVGSFQKIDYNFTLLTPLLSQIETIVFDELSEGELKQSMRQLDLTVSRVLKVKNEIIGLLLLGEKSSGEIYSEQDLRVIDILSPEMAVAIQNAQSYDKIKKFNVILTEEVKKATFDLQKANVKLKELDQLKDEFVSVASHELRTPMTAIRSYVWMALSRSDVPLSEKLKRYLTRALISTERLINLVNDMLNISRIESGRVEIIPTPFSIVELAKEVYNEIELKAREKNIAIHILASNVPEVFADPDKILQVFLNLLGNAMKFTPSGGDITISFFTDGRIVETSIKDTGVGISKEDIGHLFKKFGRLDNSYVAAATSGGTGLGLYICRTLIELSQGSIKAYSPGVGQGSVFSFTLPVASNDILKQADKFTKHSVGEAKGLEPFSL